MPDIRPNHSNYQTLAFSAGRNQVGVDAGHDIEHALQRDGGDPRALDPMQRVASHEAQGEYC